MDQCIIIRSDTTLYSCVVSADIAWCKEDFRIQLIWIYACLDSDIAATGFDERVTE